ncbi:MAG: cell division protein FtsB [Gammaproteobacteria bacterium]|jgi:cell division protein FtsB
MRLLIISLCLVLLVLQYQLWLADSGIRATWGLEAAVTARTDENEQKAERNAALEAEVLDLKQGLAAVEERARSELGMIGRNETFYLVTRPSNGASAPP